MYDKKKYLWFTDTHLNLAWPFSARRLIRIIQDESPEGVFITGDISDGKHVEYYLDRLASELTCNIYFVLGNHDFHHRTIASVHSDIKRLSNRYSNLFWLTDSEVISLNEDTAIIGTEGWYDAKYGNSNWLRYTLDRFFIIDFKSKNSLQEQMNICQSLAKKSAEMIEKKLTKALENHKTVYILTHFPPWKEATRDEGTWLESFWLPYNTNTLLGDAIEKVMKGRKKKKSIVLAGHTHEQVYITVKPNIECRVNKANYFGMGSKTKQRILL